MTIRLAGPTIALKYKPDMPWQKVEHLIGMRAQIMWFAGIATTGLLWHNIYLFEKKDGSYEAIQPIYTPENEDKNEKETLTIKKWEASPKGSYIKGDDPDLTIVPAVIRITHNDTRLAVSPGNLPKGSFPMEYDVHKTNNICAIRLSERSVSLFNPKSEANAASLIYKDMPYVLAAIRTFADRENEPSRLHIFKKLDDNDKIIWQLATLSSELETFGVTQNVVPKWLIGTPVTITFNNELTQCTRKQKDDTKTFNVSKKDKTIMFHEIKDIKEVKNETAEKKTTMQKISDWFKPQH